MNSKADAVRDSFPQLANIKNKEWVEKIIKIWVEVWDKSAWDGLHDCPYNSLAPEISLVEHVNQVVDGAVDLANQGKKFVGTKIDMDVLLAAGILHDVCKLVEYEPDSDGKAHKSDLGKRYQHGFYGAFKAEAEGFPMAVVQIIINHTISSNEIPNTPEALCIYYSDMCAADLARLDANAPLLVESHK
ncbi:MAG TPA: HD domain-containing protein [Bacillales bacterium]|nr:HD domain-containing protein [Bacillales bacterium]